MMYDARMMNDQRMKEKYLKKVQKKVERVIRKCRHEENIIETILL